MNTRISKDIDQAETLLNAGELVAVPTETVYGLAACFNNIQAVRRIFDVKNRPAYDPLILHASSIEMIREQIVSELPALAEKLGKKFWPGPLSIVLPKKNSIDTIITSGLKTVAVRIPGHQDLIQLIDKLEIPLAAPSANPFGYISPTTAMHVLDQLEGKIPLILDGGPAKIGLESTIVEIINDHIIILRTGGISIDDLKKFDPDLEIKSSSSQPKAPGMLEKHYAPKKSFYYENEFDPEKDNSKVGLIRFKSFSKEFPVENQLILSPEGDLNVAASKLYSAMREMDQSKFEIILTETFQKEGIGIAMNDRIRRAVTGK